MKIKTISMISKKSFTFAIITLLFIGILNTSAQAGFRNTNWGDSPTQVKSSETGKINSENSVRIIYDCEMADIKGKLFYIFTRSNKLLRTKYFLTPEYTNSNFYIRDYKMFYDLLSLKYGKMLRQSATDLGGASVKEADWPAYIASGNLRVETKWVYSGVDILLTISNIEKNTVIQIDYMSNKISEIDLMEKKKKTATQL